MHANIYVHYTLYEMWSSNNSSDNLVSTESLWGWGGGHSHGSWPLVSRCLWDAHPILPNHSHLSCQLAFSLEKSTRPLISVHFHRPPAVCFVLVQMVQTFSRCILCSKDEVDLDELLAARLVTFLMDNYQEILKVPLVLQTSIEERVAHLRRVQVKGETLAVP